jgi:hypothetical protein
MFQGRLQEPTLKVARKLGFQATSQFEKHDFCSVLGRARQKRTNGMGPKVFVLVRWGEPLWLASMSKKKPFERKQTSHIIVSSFHIPQSKLPKTFQNKPLNHPHIPLEIFERSKKCHCLCSVHRHSTSCMKV